MSEQEKLAKAIKALEICVLGADGRCFERDCPYYQGDCLEALQADLLAMLKAREPVEPVRRRRHGQIGYSCFCGMCGYGIGRNEKYCALCGRQAKWR